MPEKLNVSLVGCGGMAAHYLSVYNDLDWVRVVSCVDASLESAQRAAAAFDLSPRATNSFDAALEDAVDVVVISTPNGQHAPQGIAAIEAGKHVLLQKPLAATVKDAEAIESAAASSTRTVGLYMSYFDQPLIHDLRDMTRAGRFGDIVHCYARLMHRGGMTWSREALEGKPTWRGSLAETGGGCFIQLAVHYIHIFEWVTGQRVVKATALATNLHCRGLQGDDLSSAVLQLDSGALITLDMAWCTDGEELAIHGTRGRVEYRGNRDLLIASDTGEEQREMRPPAFGDASNPLNQHRLFLEACRDGKPAPVSVASGVRDMRIVAAVYESVASGRVVVLP